MSKRKYIVLIFLMLIMMLSSIGAATWIIISPITSEPLRKDGFIPEVEMPEYTIYEGNNFVFNNSYTATYNGAKVAGQISLGNINPQDNLHFNQGFTKGSIEGLGEVNIYSTSQVYQSVTTDTNVIYVPITFTPDDQNEYETVQTYAKFTIKAVAKRDEYYFGTVETALAQSNAGTVRVLHLPSEDNYIPIIRSNCTVSSNVTLLLQRTEEDAGLADHNRLSGSGEEYESATVFGASVAANMQLYTRLRVTGGVTLSVNGTLLVNAAIYNTAAHGNDSSYTDKSRGYSELELLDGSTLVLQNGSKLYCYGYIYGKGNIEAQSGSTVTEMFALVGWKGGSVSVGIRKQVFPLNQYTLANIISHIKVYQGATYNVRACVTASDLHVDQALPFISPQSDAFMHLTSSGYVEKWVDDALEDDKDNKNYGKATHNVHFDLHGNVSFSNIVVDPGFEVGSIHPTIDTADTQVPIPGNFDITLSSGTSTIPSNVSLKLLPGADLTIGGGATLNVQGNAYAYSYSEDEPHVTYTENLTKWIDSTMRDYPIGYSSYPHRLNTQVYYDYDATESATVIILGGGVLNASGTVAGDISGKEGALMILNGALSASIGEDYNTVLSSTNVVAQELLGRFGNAGKMGTLYTATIIGYAINESKPNAPLGKGGWRYTGGAWETTATTEIKYKVQYKTLDNNGVEVDYAIVDYTAYALGTVTTYEVTNLDIADPTRWFYDFTTWYGYSSNIPFDDLSASQRTVHNGDTITVVAGWNVAEYTINYVVSGSGGGTVTNPNATTWSLGSSFELKDATIDISGYKFNNWYFDSGFNYGVSTINEETLRAALEAGLITFEENTFTIYGYFFEDRAYRIDFSVSVPDNTYTEVDISGLQSFFPDNATAKINQPVSELVALLPNSSTYKLEYYDYDVNKQYYFDGWEIAKTNKIITADSTETLTLDDFYDEGGGNLVLTIGIRWSTKYHLTISMSIDWTSSLASRTTAIGYVTFSYSNGTGYNESEIQGKDSTQDGIAEITSAGDYWIKPNEEFSINFQYGNRNKRSYSNKSYKINEDMNFVFTVSGYYGPLTGDSMTPSLELNGVSQ